MSKYMEWERVTPSVALGYPVPASFSVRAGHPYIISPQHKSPRQDPNAWPSLIFLCGKAIRSVNHNCSIDSISVKIHYSKSNEREQWHRSLCAPRCLPHSQFLLVFQLIISPQHKSPRQDPNKRSELIFPCTKAFKSTDHNFSSIDKINPQLMN